MIELSFQIDPDENDIIDGRDLARAMVQTAYRLLIPYVNDCPACSDALFTAVANDAIEEIHQDGQRGRIMNVQGEDPGGVRWQRHRAASEDFTQMLLGRQQPRPTVPKHLH